MTRREAHLAEEELVALTFTAAGTPDVRDADALAHLAGCPACGGRLAEVAASLADLRLAAEDEADSQFPEAALERQRRQILARLEHLGQQARILRFPVTTAAAAAPLAAPRPPVRRWLAGAVAAGLLGGFLLAETLHVLPGDAAWTAGLGTGAGSTGVELADVATLEEDEFLSELDAALGFSRSSELRALDALTPVAYEIR
ncbi:MAG: hypothetical protein Q8L86_18865 [Vicinamibacterales bacterium]|nr:hypothetical protein [Vicinamibacterales bacterium]